MHPRLTSVAIPVDDIARRVVARALKQVDHGPDHDPGEVVPTKLRLGESTGGFGRDASRADERAGQAGEGAGAEQGRALEGPSAPGGNAAALTWNRFQEAALSAGTSTLTGEELPAGSPLAPGAGPVPAVRRVTIADVAADAGVGVGTVSRVLNGSEQVRESTLRAVLDSIDRLGYRPSHAAAALVRGTPRTVALIVAHLTRPSTVVRVASALAVLEEQGYDTIVYNVDSPLERDRHLEALLPTHRADGVLAVCLPLSRDQLDQFARAGVALVSVDADQPRGAADGYRRRGRRPAGDRPPDCAGAPPDRLRRRHAVQPAPGRAGLHLLGTTGCAGTSRPWPRRASAWSPA